MKHAVSRSQSNAVTVLTAFVVALLMFAGVLVIPMIKSPVTDEPPVQADSVPAHVWQVGLLFYDTDRQLTGVVRLVVDTQTMQLQAVGYPPSADIGGKSLQQWVDADGSMGAFERLCEEESGVADGVISLSVSDVAAFIVYLKERLPLTLSEPMEILPSGEQLLTPMQVADVLRYREWEQGEYVQAQMHAQVVAALLNRYLTVNRNFETDFKKLTTLCDEPLNISQYAAAKDILQALAEHNDGHICNVSGGRF